ncbi:Crp/Fnr family transcriptional regulator [Dehalobacter sp. 14DCB1]|uniref:Crp/Fnr family transcriptional regulator n=1 Tax=Dehalobacter sp. 14DCB1 TaxID=2070227 RepID=UPI00104BDB0C|nr:Crp/Fnr family transcriptional regulator [Dehalobacter sp. 14DCB1]TCX53492.1 Crp/Fnr family transcriptional regulator [Dehalobacter sp. 14DCB1]
MKYDFSDEVARTIPDTFYPVEKLQKFIHLGIVKSYAKGSAITLPGDREPMLIYVLSGKVQIKMVTEDGRERLHYFCGKNGILCKLFPMNHDNSYITAIEKCSVCFFTEEQLKAIFQIDDDIFFEILKNTFSKSLYFMMQTVEMELFNPTIRIVRLIYGLCISNGIPVGNSYEVRLELSQRTISEISGVHHVTISKVLGYLEKQKIIEKKKGKIIIHDLDRLKELTFEKHLF